MDDIVAQIASIRNRLLVYERAVLLPDRKIKLDIETQVYFVNCKRGNAQLSIYTIC